jgi:transposase
MQTRRRFSLAFKQQLVAATLEPGASVAGVALEHKINANQLHAWRRELRRTDSAPSCAVLPVTMVPDTPPVQGRGSGNGTIHIELSQARVSIQGSVDATLLEAVIRLLR